MIDTVLMLALASYLTFNGFFLLGLIASGFYLLLTAALGLIWMLTLVKVPVRLRDSVGKPNCGSRLRVLLRLLMAVVFLVIWNAITSVWPIDNRDLRLGLMLAALAFVFGTSLTLLRSPLAATRLRSLRSRLAFGTIDVEAAKSEAECILHGTPEEHYVAAKAEAAIAEMREYVRVCGSLTARMERIISLADKVGALAPDEAQALLRQNGPELRYVVKKVLAELKAMDGHMKAAVKLRLELERRVEAAQAFLDLKPDIVRGILNRVDSSVKEADEARRGMVPATRFKAAYDVVCAAHKGITLPRKWKLSDALAAVFRD